MNTLSRRAQHMLAEIPHGAFIPKSTVEGQWDPETCEAFQELIRAGMVEEISVLVLHTLQVDRLKHLLLLLMQLHAGQLAGVDVRESMGRQGDELHLTFLHVEQVHVPVLRAIGVACFASSAVEGVLLDSGYTIHG